MTFDEYQNTAGITDKYPAKHYETVVSCYAMGLASEAGEAAGAVKKWVRDRLADALLREKLLSELGDVLWYVARMASAMDLTLEDIAKHNVAKLRSRHERNAIGGDGDNR